MSTYERVQRLLKKGIKVRCSWTGWFFHLSEMKPDGKGGYWSIKHVKHKRHDQKADRTEGPDWFRGSEF